MPKRFTRKHRLDDLIQTELAIILQKEENNLKIGMVTITEVDIAPDLAYARIFVSVLDENQAINTVAILNQAAKTLRYALAQVIKLRFTPELRFIYDDSIVRGSHISSLIDHALKKTHPDDSKKPTD